MSINDIENQKLAIKSLDFPDQPICSTCKSKIEFYPYRHLTLKNNDICQVLFFHYFYPCWDIDYITKHYMRYDFSQMGFTFDPDFLPSIQSLHNIKRNVDLWIEDGY